MTDAPALGWSPDRPHPSAAWAPLLERSPVRVELGCGASKTSPLAVGIDLRELPGVDLVGDAVEVLRSCPSGRVDEIHSEHFLEHLSDPSALLTEAARVLRPGGTLVAVVPHFSNPWFYSDPTHHAFFGLYTLSYWVHDPLLKRRVPHYGEPLPFDLRDVRLVFKSGPPFYGRHAVKKALTWWVNRSVWTREFYEEVLSPSFPCYEVCFRLERRAEGSPGSTA
jgi:SAM-dependent methyltransferase